MQTWIFQGNTKTFDIDGYLASSTGYIRWRVAQYANEMTLPLKRQDIGWVFRGETAQAGRFRGFHQADVDIIGRQLGVAADVECLMAMGQALVVLGIGGISIHINHIAIPKGLLRRVGVTTEQEATVLRIIDKLEKIGSAKVAAELLIAAPQLSPAMVEKLLTVFTFRGNCATFKSILEQACKQDDEIMAGFAHLASLEALFEQQQNSSSAITLVVNPGLVRGLDYYTGVVAETFVAGYEAFGSMASGGRYNNLVGSFSDKHNDLEGVGFSIGVTRLFDVLCRAKAINLERKTSADILIAYRPEALDQAFEAASFLRKQGQKIDMYANPARPIKHQLEYAAKKGIPFVLMLMSDEYSNASAYVLKNLATREQVEWANKNECFTNICGKL